MNPKLAKKALAQAQWSRYTMAMTRGHIEYQRQANLNENFYLGGGRQWDDTVKAELESAGKPWLEENIIFSTVNTVLGYQTQSRMDINYKPREQNDQETSDVLTQVGMYVVDRNRFPWKESQVFADGMIQQRGYFDIRMDFSDNLNGDVKIDTLDPLDVIPDPDAKDYDPDEWADVMTLKWMTLDDVKEVYGVGKYRQILNSLNDNDEPDWGDGGDGFGEPRNKFGSDSTYFSYYRDEGEEVHVRLIERQHWKMQNRNMFYDTETGELYPAPDGLKEPELKKQAKQQGYELIKRLSRRIRWTVTSKDVVLHDDWSPYEHFTVVPFFPYFRRGTTVGMVDNLIKTQEMLNKVYSQILHVVNTTANSGWTVEEGTLTNMDTEDLTSNGADTGLVLEHKRGSNAPKKIEPNQIPSGLKDLVTSSVDLIRLISGVSETFQGGKGPEVSGTAIQSRVQQSAIQLATPVDNLFKTRNMIAERLLKLIQTYYTDERAFLIIGQDIEEGEDQQVDINKEDPDTGEILNDVTKGRYDVVIADVPTQITFQNAQMSQAIELRKYGIEIPDDEMVRMSTLTRKDKIAAKMTGEASQAEQEQAAAEAKLQIETLEATIEKLEAESNKQHMEAAAKAADIATQIAANPSIAPLIDTLLNTYTEDEEEMQEEHAGGMQDMPQGQGLMSNTSMPPQLGGGQGIPFQ